MTTGSRERVKAFVPEPLPPIPRIRSDGPLQRNLEHAHLALGRLDSPVSLLPTPSLFLYSYVRKEAVLSSQIEGKQSSLSDLLLFELHEMPRAPLDDVAEVSSYVAALEHGIRRVRAGMPLSSRLIREVHGVLLSRGRGSGKDEGEFRRSQNWIGGTRPGNAIFVPPPHTQVPNCIGALEQFLHDDSSGLPVLLRAGLAHAQFETIHPFLDGNGRVGRLLIVLLLCEAGVLREPLLYLSLYLKQHRTEYYELLQAVRRGGDWEAWLEFFLEGVRQTAEGAVATAGRLSALFQQDQDRLLPLGRKSGSALRVHEALKARPITSMKEVRTRTGLSGPAATSGMDVLVELKIARELTGQRRNRAFGYTRYLAVLNED